jgi:hypothetical protein
MNWTKIVELESEYFENAYNFLKNISVEEMKSKLNNIQDSYTILRLLGPFSFQNIKDFILSIILKFSVCL